MTRQHFLRTAATAAAGAALLVLAAQARAEGVILPERAEALVEAQKAEGEAAKAALEEELAAVEKEEAESAAKAAKASGRNAAKSSSKKRQETNIAAKPDTGEAVAGPSEQPAAKAVVRRGHPGGAGDLKPLIARYASENGIPFALADAVVRLESRYNAAARNGPNLGLTQVNFRTAQSLGYRGDAAGLFDPETNLRFGLKYLAQAYKLAGGDTCGTILRYQFGHRSTAMTAASRSYCAKVKVIAAAAE